MVFFKEIGGEHQAKLRKVLDLAIRYCYQSISRLEKNPSNFAEVSSGMRKKSMDDYTILIADMASGVISDVRITSKVELLRSAFLAAQGEIAKGTAGYTLAEVSRDSRDITELFHEITGARLHV